ncbi:hypothetical protein KC326_g9385, partial [Hortaea werneckii]
WLMRLMEGFGARREGGEDEDEEEVNKEMEEEDELKEDDELEEKDESGEDEEVEEEIKEAFEQQER